VRLRWTAAALALLAAPAEAHLVQTGFGTFYDGIAHLALTPADLLVVIALGLLAGLRGAPASRRVLLAVPAAWLAGGLAGSAAPGAGGVPWGTAISVVLVGALVAADARLPDRIVVGLAAAAGALHGAANGATLAPEGGDALTLLGAAVAAFALVTLLSALVVSLHAPWARIAVRVSGSWVAAIGLLMIGWIAR